jgi:hypothetical protein
MARLAALLVAVAAWALPGVASAATSITVLSAPDPAPTGQPVVVHVEGVVDGRTTSLVVAPFGGPGDAASTPVGPGAFAVDLTLAGLDRSVFGVRATLEGDDANDTVERELLLHWDFSDLIRIVRARPVWFGLAVTVDAPAALGGEVFLEVDGRPCNSFEKFPREGRATIYSCALRATQKVVHVSARRDVSDANGGQAFTPPVTVDRTAEAAGGPGRVTTDRGIAGLWLGTSRADVEALAGKHGRFDFGTFHTLTVAGLLVRYDAAGRLRFSGTPPTAAGHFATDKGVTARASAARLRSRYPNARCVDTVVRITFPVRFQRGKYCYFGAKAARGANGHPATWLSTVPGLELLAVAR